MGPLALNIYFINDPRIDIMIQEFKNLGQWHLSAPDFKQLPLRMTVHLSLLLMFLHSYTTVLILIVYCDVSIRLIKFVHTTIIHLGSSKVTNKRIVNDMLTNVSQMYTEQKILNLVEWDMLQIFSLVYITIILPYLIVWVYICIRYSRLILWFLYLPILLTTSIVAMCVIFIHVYASGLYEHSYRLLNSFQKNIIPFNTCDPYWRKKFRSFRNIKVGVFWWKFSYANLLPMCSYVLTVIINLLLL